MSNKNLTIWLTVVAIIAVIGWFIPVQLAPVAGGTRYPNGLSADGTSPNAGQVRGTTLTITSASALAATTLSGTLTVTTTNAATSTAIAGCVQTYATSTATPVHFGLIPSNISTTTFSGTSVGGVVIWAYGVCPL